MFSSVGFSTPVVWAGVFAVSGLAPAAMAEATGGVTADAVVEYVPGAITSSGLQQSGNAAIGLPAAVDDGQTSPFTPPFHASSITVIGAGGHITLHLSAPLSSGDQELGVFTNTGLVATTSNGVVTAATAAGGGAAVFSRDAAIVSVSEDDATWVALNGGIPMDLTMPSNAFTDGVLSSSGGITVSGGTIPSNPFVPFTGTLSEFAGLSYPQMLTLLDGSFGGAWVDTGSAGIPEINYVRFDVPSGDRLVLDAVTGVPEPAGGAALLGGALVLLRRRARPTNKK